MNKSTRDQFGVSLGDVEDESAALTRRASELDFTAEQVGQLATDREAQSGSAIAAACAGVGLLESLEDDFLLAGINADAGVAHGKGHHGPGAP